MQLGVQKRRARCMIGSAGPPSLPRPMITNLILLAILVMLLWLLTAVKKGFNQVIAGLEVIAASKSAGAGAGSAAPGA